jgi:hypothetical protein
MLSTARPGSPHPAGRSNGERHHVELAAPINTEEFWPIRTARCSADVTARPVSPIEVDQVHTRSPPGQGRRNPRLSATGRRHHRWSAERAEPSSGSPCLELLSHSARVGPSSSRGGPVQIADRYSTPAKPDGNPTSVASAVCRDKALALSQTASGRGTRSGEDRNAHEP